MKIQKLLALGFLFSLNTFSYEIISNFGRTGLMEIPTAYTVKDGHIVFGGSYVYPYLRGYVNVGFFPGLEIGGVITQINNIYVKGNIWRGYGKYKDKAFFAKYQILPEMGKFPAIAIGWDDFHGTKLFDTKYLVITKYVELPLLKWKIPQNVTFGYAKGNMLDGFFGGTEILLHPKLSFMFEYAPIQPSKLKGLSEIKRKLSTFEKFNFGLKWQPSSWLQITTSYQRREEWGINISFDIPMGKPWVPHIPRYFRLSKKDIKLIKENKQTEFYEKALKRLGFNNPKVYIKGDTLYVEYTNNTYFFESVALKKALLILKVLYFPGIKKVVVINKVRNVPVTIIEIPGYYLNLFLTKSLSFKELIDKSKIDFANYKIKPHYNEFIEKIKWTIYPKLRTFLNDPSGAFKYMLSLDIGANINFLNNFWLTSYLYIPIVNNISTVNKPLMKRPVNSDIAYYLEQKKANFSVFSINYLGYLWNKTFIGISAGYNELRFAGIGGDILHFFGNGRFAVGLGGDYVIKRNPNSSFGLRKGWDFHDEYIAIHYYTKFPEMHLAVKAGRFLAGDKGVRFEVSRIVKGFEVGFWYTYSDTSNFTGPNKNYHDKGIFIRIPLRIFKLKDTQTVASYALAPWSRDVGQLAGRPFDLYYKLVHKLPFYIKQTLNEEE
jgi:hypothetical protein